MIKKIAAIFLVILVCTYLGHLLSGKLYTLEANVFERGTTFLKAHWFFLIVSHVVIYLLDMYRLKLIAQALKLNLNMKDCFGAVALNLLFGWVSPGAILGAPATAYYLVKQGYPLVESITIAFVRSFFIIMVSALTTLTIYGFSLQGPVSNTLLQEKVFIVLAFIALYIGAIVLFSYMNFPWVKRVKFLDKITTQVRTFLNQGLLLSLPIALITLIDNFLFVGLIPAAVHGLYQDWLPLFSQTMLFLSYILLMPIPGASGLAEIGAPLFFGDAVPVNDLIPLITAMRFSSFVAQVGTGLVFLGFFFRRNVSTEELYEFKKEL